jgi:GntR family transcriptional regulator
MNFSTLLPQLAEMSRSTTARLLSFTYAEAPPHVAEAMGLENSSHVQIASRVRFTNGLPFSHLTTYVPESIACNYSEHDLATTPLYELLERGGVTIDNAHQSVSATLASPTVAKALNIAVGTALLSINRVVRDSEGCAVEYLSARYRPDLFRLDMDLTRVNEGASRQWQPVIHAANNPLPSNADSVVDSENSGSGVSAQQGSRESA